jgi:hypothetical protein
VISWFVILLDTYAYFFINIVLLSYSLPLSIILGVVYGLIFIAVLYYAIITTRYDPTDPTIYAERAAKASE